MSGIYDRQNPNSCDINAHLPGGYGYSVRVPGGIHFWDSSPRFIHHSAYALSGFNRKLLAVFLSIGATYVVLAVAIIHNIVVAGKLHPIPRYMRNSLTRHLVVPYTKEPFEALGMCLKNPGRALGFSCTAAVLAFGVFLLYPERA